MDIYLRHFSAEALHRDPCNPKMRKPQRHTPLSPQTQRSSKGSFQNILLPIRARPKRNTGSEYPQPIHSILHPWWSYHDHATSNAALSTQHTQTHTMVMTCDDKSRRPRRLRLDRDLLRPIWTGVIRVAPDAGLHVAGPGCEEIADGSWRDRDD